MTNYELIQEIIRLLRDKDNTLEKGYGRYIVGDRMEEKSAVLNLITNDSNLYETNNYIITRALLLLPTLFYKKNRTRIELNKIETDYSYNWALKDIRSRESMAPGLYIVINKISRYTIESVKREQTEYEKEFQNVLKQTPKHVVYVEKEPKKQIYIINSNRYNIVLITEAILLILKNLEKENIIELDKEEKELLAKIFKKAQEIHNIVDINGHNFINEIKDYIIQIYDKIFNLKTFEQQIEINKYKQAFTNFNTFSIEKIRQNLTHIETRINQEEHILYDLYKRLTDTRNTKIIQENITKEQIANPIKILLNNKNIKIIRIDCNSEYLEIQIEINTLLTNIDYIAFEKGLIRLKEIQSTEHPIKRQAKKVIKMASLFLLNGPKYAMKTTQKLKISCKTDSTNLQIQTIQYNPYTTTITNVWDTIKAFNGIPNPHLNYYNCFGTTITELAKCNNLYESFQQYLNILTSCVGNLNINDYAVMQKFFDICNAITHDYADNAIRIKLFKNLETGEELTIKELKETEDYINAPTNWKDLV